mgnify:CR=1 FL=1
MKKLFLVVISSILFAFNANAAALALKANRIDEITTKNSFFISYSSLF